MGSVPTRRMNYFFLPALVVRQSAAMFRHMTRNILKIHTKLGSICVPLYIREAANMKKKIVCICRYTLRHLEEPITHKLTNSFDNLIVPLHNF